VLAVLCCKDWTVVEFFVYTPSINRFNRSVD
jgi:hypothetical protein